MNESDYQRDTQLAATPEAAHAAQIEGRLKQLHTMLPGIVSKFDPATQSAEVQPAIKRIFTDRGAVALPLCVDVPVQFPGGGGFWLTFPVQPGDECALYFSERCIDFWWANGGVQLPAEYRTHDLSDAFALVGVNSKPNALPSFNANDVEVRDRARGVRTTWKHDGTIENVNGAGSTVLDPAGKFTINAPGGVLINAPTTEHTGNVQTDGNTTINGTTLSKGTITGQAGMGITGAPSGGGASVQITGNITQTGSLTASGTITGTTDVIGGGKSLKTHTHSDPQGGTTGAPT